MPPRMPVAPRRVCVFSAVEPLETRIALASRLGPLSVSIGDATVSEGDFGTKTLTFHVGLSYSRFMGYVTVHYSTANGTAVGSTTPGAGDFLPVDNGVIEFHGRSSQYPFGDTQKQVSITSFGDRVFETDETFTVILSDASGAFIADATGIGTIQNDDPDGPTRPTVSIADATVIEGDSGTKTLAFNVTLSEAFGSVVTVLYSTIDGTAVGSTTAGSGDFLSVSNQTITFNPGETSKQASITINGDTDVESDETLSVQLSSAANAVIIADRATGTIKYDDFVAVPVSIKGKKATYPELDGDLVTVKVSKGSLQDSDFFFFPIGALQTLYLANHTVTLNHSKLKITVQQTGGGDGILEAGKVDATGLSLRELNIDCDVSGLTLVADKFGVLKVGGDLDDSIVRSNTICRMLKVTGAVTDSEITARGILAPSEASKVTAFDTVEINGGFIRSKLLAGYDLAGVVVNANVSINLVTIGGDFEASSIVAGTYAGSNGLFGDQGDSAIAWDDIVPIIASVTVNGRVRGTDAIGDHFGIVAEEIGELLGGAAVSLTSGPSNDIEPVALGGTSDVTVREVYADPFFDFLFPHYLTNRWTGPQLAEPSPRPTTRIMPAPCAA